MPEVHEVAGTLVGEHVDEGAQQDRVILEPGAKPLLASHAPQVLPDIDHRVGVVTSEVVDPVRRVRLQWDAGPPAAEHDIHAGGQVPRQEQHVGSWRVPRGVHLVERVHHQHQRFVGRKA